MFLLLKKKKKINDLFSIIEMREIMDTRERRIKNFFYVYFHELQVSGTKKI